MKTAGRNLGVNFDRPKLEKIYNRREEDLLNDLRKIIITMERKSQ